MKGRWNAPRRVPLEKVEQANTMNLLRSIGATPYTVGTRRRRGDYQGTMQTPGLPDIFAFLPPPPLKPGASGIGLWIEQKRSKKGRLSDAQIAFRDKCLAHGLPHVTGDVNAVIGFLIDGGWLSANSVAHYRRPADRS